MGQQGYGWLPYDYVLKGLAVDWWSLMDELCSKVVYEGMKEVAYS